MCEPVDHQIRMIHFFIPFAGQCVNLSSQSKNDAMSLEPFLPFMLRVILGLLFFFQAYDILFRIGLKTTLNAVFQGTRNKKIPDGFTRFSVVLSSLISLFGGLLLILGLFREAAMILLGINLIMTALGFGYLNGLWDMRHFFPRLAILVLLMLMPNTTDTWCLDALLFN